jgi:hypothetical protein
MRPASTASQNPRHTVRLVSNGHGTRGSRYGHHLSRRHCRRRRTSGAGRRIRTRPPRRACAGDASLSARGWQGREYIHTYTKPVFGPVDHRGSSPEVGGSVYWRRYKTEQRPLRVVDAQPAWQGWRRRAITIPPPSPGGRRGWTQTMTGNLSSTTRTSRTRENAKPAAAPPMGGAGRAIASTPPSTLATPVATPAVTATPYGGEDP